MITVERGSSLSATTARLVQVCLGALAGALVVAGCSGGSTGRSDVGHAQAGSRQIHLSPDPAYAVSRIDVVFDGPWIDRAKCRYQWRRDGAVIEGARSGSLEPSQFSKGQRISVEVALGDSAPLNLTATVEVRNTPPKITGVDLWMTSASGTPSLQANVQSSDPDADRVSYEYRWFRNGEQLGGEGGATMTTDKLVRGDRVAVEAVASDGQSSSAPLRSPALTIENRPPQFTSQPPAPGPTDAAFRYQIVAADRDGDALSYNLVSAPAGMTVNPGGVVVWPLPPPDQRRGDYPVAVRVTDSKGGEATQEFLIRFETGKKAADVAARPQAP